MTMRFTSRNFVLLCCILTFLSITARSQDKKLITGNFSGFSFAQLVNEAEKQTGMRFYYNAAETDSLRINISANGITLSALLDQVLKNTGLQYAINPRGEVFISLRFAIQTDLPPGFFVRSIKNKDSASVPVIPLAEENKPKEKLKNSVENKLFEIGIKGSDPNKTSSTIAGYIRDVKNGEAITGASVYVDSPAIGVISDQFGYYSVTLPKGRHSLQVSSAGMKDTRRQVLLQADGKLDIEMETFVPSLKTVVITAEKKSNVRSLQMGLERLSIKSIKQVPVVLGEADILRVILTLPGVTSVGEASTGFNVRGGSSDQNLILFNDATIYNPSHLFGFFSSFNPDVVKNVELYKSAIPEKYGGRLSSVLDVSSRDGNNKKISGSGGIGPLISKLVIEGPLAKEKTTFIIGGRTTYSNWILKTIPNESYNNSRASFYDANLHINHAINNKNNLYLTGYMSGDKFKLNNDTLYQYNNRNINLKWKHNFSNKFYGVLTGGFDNYQYAVSADQNKVNAFKLDFDIKQVYLRADFSYSAGNKHNFNFGINSIRYALKPGAFQPVGSQSLVTPDEVQAEQALESAVYFGDKYSITPKLSVNGGIRFSLFNYLGPHDVYSYIPGLPRDKNSLIDTIVYAKGKSIKNYLGPEYRLTLRYSLTDNSSVKISYNTLRQYIHLLSNTAAISPTDVWKLSDPNIKPQLGDQFSLGYYRNFKSNTIETSLEVYYKRLKNFLDYKSGATIIMNKQIETAIITTRGKAYGAELLIKKLSGKVNGWFSYTWSRTLLQQDDPIAGELINEGKYYPANYDKPHNVNLVSNYKFSHRYSLSLNVVYNTGRPVTLPIAIFNLGGAQRVLYSDRNAYRIPDYFRTDLSINIEGNHKIKKLAHSSWSFGVYNILARQNAFSVYFVQQNAVIKGYKLSIFGTAIPYVTYNFKF